MKYRARVVGLVLALLMATPSWSQDEGFQDVEVDGPIDAPIDADAAASGWGEDEPLVHGIPASEYYSSTVRGVWGGPPLDTIMQRHMDMALDHTDPVSGNGELVLQRTDITLLGFGLQYEFRRTYRSRVRHQSPLGYGWVHNYDRRIVLLCQAGVAQCFGDVAYQSGSLERMLFRPTSTDETAAVIGYAPDAGVPLQLFRKTGPVGHRWVLHDGTGVDAYFDGDYGTLSELKDPLGNRLTFTWIRDESLPDGGMLDFVTDTTGRKIYYVYGINRQPNGPAAAVQLQCVSLQRNCHSPLVSFQMSSDARGNGEFDLIAVRDAMGRTQSFDYFQQVPSSDLSIDDESLGRSCHLLCDSRTADPASWQNSDLCEAAVQDVLKFRCDFADAAALPILFQPEPLVCDESQVPCHPHSLQTTDGQLLPWLDQAPMMLDLAHSQTYWDVRYPGFRYCTESCVSHPLDPTICSSDVFPACKKLSSQISGPEGDTLDAQTWLYYREACHCILATNQTFCALHPAFADCAQVTSDDAAIGVSGNMMTGYSARCHGYFDPILHAANVDCPAKCDADCTAKHGAHDAAGLRRYAFGAVNDLNHNITDVYDGDGRLVLHNEYGLDRFTVSYDRVVRQTLGDGPRDNVVSIAYHDLTLEQQSIDGTLPVLEGTSAADFAAAGLPADGSAAAQAEMALREHLIELDPAHVTPSAAFGLVDVCPQTCTQHTPVTAIVGPTKTVMMPIDEHAPPDVRGPLGEALPVILRAVNDREVEVATGSAGVTAIDTSHRMERRASMGADGAKAIRSAERAPSAAHEIARLGTKFGPVSLRSMVGGEVDLLGSPRAIDAVFGKAGAIELVPAAGGQELIRSVGPRQPRTTERTLPNTHSGRLATQSISDEARGGYRAASESAATRGARTKASSRLTSREGVALPEAGSEDALGAELVRAGIIAGSTRLTIRRTGPRTAALPPAAAAGTSIGSVTVDGTAVALQATAVPLRFAVDGGVAGVLGRRTTVMLIQSGRNAWMVSAVPGTPEWAADARNAALIAAARERMKSHPPLVCTAWGYGDAAAHVGEIDPTQAPKYAAVVTDAHGITHTQYYDGAWREVRDVNPATNQQIDRNYFSNGGSCTRYPAGNRLVLNTDSFGRVTQMTQLPAKGFAGDAVVQTDQMDYAASGALARGVKAAGTADASTVTLRRDFTGRLEHIDLGVNDSPLMSFGLDYATVAGSDPHDVAPAVIHSPSGIDTKFVQFDPSGGGPRVVIGEANTSRPIITETTYDVLGRMKRTFRSKHPGTRLDVTYDRSGMVTHVIEADHVDPRQQLTTTVVHNFSGQLLRVENENLRTCYQFNSLDQLVWLKEIATADASVQRSMCMHHGVDGRMEYAILPEGNVMVWHYGSDGRLGSLQQGKPANLNQWAQACVADAPPPVRRHVPRPFGETATEVQPSSPGTERERAADARSTATTDQRVLTAQLLAQRAEQTRTHQRVSAGALTDYRLPREVATRVDPCAVESPSWSADSPVATTDLQTTLSVAYQPNGFFKSVTDGAGAVTVLETDGYGRVISARDGMGSAMWQGFDAADRISWRAFVGPGSQPYHRPSVLEPTLPLLAMSEYQYDFAGRLLADRQWHFDANTSRNATPPISSTEYVYDDATRSMRIDADGQPVLALQNDELMASSSLIVGGVPWVTEHWTDLGPAGDRIDEITLSQGVYLENKHIVDDWGNVVSSRAPSGTEVAHSVFDRFGRLAQFSGASGAVTVLSDDAFDRVASWSVGGAEIGDFTYLRDDTLASASYLNSAGGPFTTSYGFDGLNRLVAMKEPLGLATQYTYLGGSSHLQTKTDPAGTLFSFAYDAAGTLRQLRAQPSTASSALVQDFGYDALGRLQFAQNTAGAAAATNGMRLEFSYDSLGCPVSESSGGVLPVRIGRQCDSHGNSTHTQFVATSGATLSIDRTFDAFGRLTQLSSGGLPVASLSFEGFGRPTQITYGDGSLQSNEALASTGLASVLSLHAGPQEIGRFAERHDANNTAIVREQAVGAWHRIDAFGADDRGRLTVEALGLGSGAPASISSAPSTTAIDASAPLAASWTRYALDSISNWTQTSRAGGSTPYAVDALNAYSMIGETAPSYDANRALTSEGASTASYDPLGHLSARTVAGQAMRFADDPLGRRAFEIDGASGKSISLIWDGGFIAGSGAATPDASALTMLANDDRDQPLAIADQFGSGAVHFLATRADGSTVAMMSAGHLEETYDYSGYGELSVRRANGTIAAVASQGNRWLYHGQWADPAAREYLFGAREYAPQLGRFLSRDPIGLDGGINAYAYAAGQPLGLADSSGTFPTAPGRGGISDAKLSEMMKREMTNQERDAVRKLLSPSQLAAIVKSTEVFKAKDPIGDVRQKVHTDSTEFLIKAGYVGIGASVLAPALAWAAPLTLLQNPSLYIGTKLMVHAPWVIPLTYHLASGYIGAPTVGNVVTRTVGAGAGALEPAVAAEIAPLSEVNIGPTFKTLEEASASGGHQAQVVLRRYGQIIATWYENSHTGSGFGGHTEQKAIARALEYVQAEGAAGVELQINGFYPPCPYGGGCMNTMQWFANQYNIIVDYSAKGAQYTFQRE